jgi:signal recognition particle subunit SRP54
MGPLEHVLGMLPGVGDLKKLAPDGVDEKQLVRIEAIINSMTAEERLDHQVISGSRRKRIARGSGTSVEDVNRLLKQFIQMRKMLKLIGGVAGMGGKRGKKRRGGLNPLRSLMR